MRTEILATGAIVALLIGGGGGYIIGASNIHTVTPASTTTIMALTTVKTTVRTTSTVTTTEVSSSLPVSPLALMTTSSHLLLRLSLANSSISQGKNITLGFSLTNVLPAPNKIPAETAWAVAGMYWPRDPCSGGYNEPLGIDIFKGFYSAGNISSGKPLFLLNPATTFCPVTLQISSWAFQPSSDIATRVSDFPSDVQLETNFTTNGYWTGGDALGYGAVFVHFGPGTYTVTAGDEWGDLVLLYFTSR